MSGGWDLFYGSCPARSSLAPFEMKKKKKSFVSIKSFGTV